MTTGYLVRSSFCDRDLFPENVQFVYKWTATTHVGTVRPSEHLTEYSLAAQLSVQRDQDFTVFQVNTPLEIFGATAAFRIYRSIQCIYTRIYIYFTLFILFRSENSRPAICDKLSRGSRCRSGARTTTAKCGNSKPRPVTSRDR